MFDVRLCSCCNPTPGPATLSFFGVRNRDEVRLALDSAREANAQYGFVDKMSGVVREDRAYIVCLDTAGDLRIDAKGFLDA